MRKITAIICILIFILLPTNVYADMGPKPSVVLNFYVFDSFAFDGLYIYFIEFFDEEFAIFGIHDGLYGSLWKL